MISLLPDVQRRIGLFEAHHLATMPTAQRASGAIATTFSFAREIDVTGL